MCVTDSSGVTVCDPTAYHVSSPTATGSEPVLLNDSNTFTITDINNGATIDVPLHVLFIVPAGDPVPTVTGASGVDAAGSFTVGTTAVGTQKAFDTTNGLFDGSVVTISSTQDLAKQINLNGGDTSLSYANFMTEFTKLGLSLPTTFDVYDATFSGVGFNAKGQSITVDGTFALGTIIAPLSLDLSTKNGKLVVTVYDTSWTNAGLVNTLSSTIPEPSTWVMMLSGFAMMGLFARKRIARYAI
jgi:hypothetical protein